MCPPFGFIGLVVSILYLVKQTRQLVTQTKASTFADAGEIMFTIGSIFVQYPDCRPYFHEGVELGSNGTERGRVLAVAEMLLDFFDYILLQQESFSIVYPTDPWQQYMVDSFAASPTLCDLLKANLTRTVLNWPSSELRVVCVAQLYPMAKDQPRCLFIDEAVSSVEVDPARCESMTAPLCR